ncbi:MAG: hypothetical protein WCE30_00745 [Mycobacterium sp.]
MTGLRTRAVRTIGRSSAGLLAVTVALLMAPAVGATPDSDAADAAITAAWTADGGAGGALGDKDGDVYQVGDGYGQNFANGKVYYTQRTGAHYVQGALLDKYQSLGGPADSDLGFPTADEGAGKADGSRDSTFSAADDPVIFWTPDNGAWVVRGAINAAWDKLGGSAGVLGVPTADETWKGSVVSQPFTGGEIGWDAKSKTFTTTPAELAGQLTGVNVPGDASTAIAAARRAAGGPLGPLGVEEGAQYKVGDKGLGQNYAGGTIFYSPDTGASAVTGQVLDKYRGAGGPQGDLGFPTGSEADGGLAPESRIVTFAAADQPVIFWTPDHGAFIVRGAMNAAWAKLGGATGKLGAPTGDQTVNGDAVSQKFTGGSISWDSSSHAFTVDPSDLTGQLAGLQVPGQDLAKNVAGSSAQGKWYQFHWWWLLAIIPLVLAVGAIVIAAALRRRRHVERAREQEDYGPHDDFADHDFADHDDHHEYADGYGDEHYGDHGGDFGDEHDLEGHFDGGPDHFQEDPDAVDTAPNEVAKFDDEHDHGAGPEPEAQQGTGWAGLGLGAAGGGAARSGLFGRRALQEEPDEAVDGGEFDQFADHDDADGAPEAEHGNAEHDSESQSHEPEAAVTTQLQAQSPAPDHGAIPGVVVGGAAVGLGAAGVAAARAGLFGHLTGGHAAEPVDAEPHEEPAVADAAPSAESMQADVSTAEAGPDEAESSPEAEPPAGPPSGRHHAIQDDEPVTAQMSFRVAVGDGTFAPAGYTIKADTKSGHYWVPGTPGYDSAPVEIWFASEDFAVTNGFVQG